MTQSGRTGRPRHLERIISTVSGEEVCVCCGRVVGTSQSYMQEDGARSEKERTAPVHNTRALGNTSPESDRKHHMMPTDKERNTRTIQITIDMLRNICIQSGYGGPIQAEAFRMMRQTHVSGFIRGRCRETMSLACIYLAHHSQGVPIPLRRFLLRHTGFVVSSGRRGFKTPTKTRRVRADIRMLKAHLIETGAFQGLHGVSIADIATKILWGLEDKYGRRVVLSAIRSLGRTGTILVGHMPQAIAAATLYVHLREESITGGMDRRFVNALPLQRVAASDCHTTEVTLRKTVGKLNEAGFVPGPAAPGRDP